MKTATAFITFIVNSDPSRILKHNSGFDFCAVGLYAHSLQRYSGLIYFYHSMVDEVSQTLGVEGLSYNQIMVTQEVQAFMDKLNDTFKMSKVAPTMGALVEYMDAEYPLVRSLLPT